jgi:hypothetical protein
MSTDPDKSWECRASVQYQIPAHIRNMVRLSKPDDWSDERWEQLCSEVEAQDQEDKEEGC